jgi:hypothetical protein
MCGLPVSRLIVLIPILFASLVPAYAQNTRLTYRPIRAEWSAALQRIVMVSSSPNQLHLFDPVSGTTQSVALGAAPVSLSIAPSGLFAAVGHVGSASYVDLTNRAVSRVYTYPAPSYEGAGRSSGVVLANEWLYVMPTDPAPPLSIKLSDGSSQAIDAARVDGARLHPAGAAIYASPPLRRFAVTAAGALANATESYAGNQGYCGGVWFSPDGSRVYTGCGTAAQADSSQIQDMGFAGAFFGSRVRAFAESAAGWIAIVSEIASAIGSHPDADDHVVLVSSRGFQRLGRLAIPKFTSGNRQWFGQGRWVFSDNSGSNLYVVYQAEIGSGVLNDFAVQTYAIGGAVSSCTATLATPTITVASEGALRAVDIRAAPDCVYKAASTEDWIQVVDGSPGSGDGSVTLHVRANAGVAARTGSVILGTQTLQVSQAGAPASVPDHQVFSYRVVDAAYSKPLDRIVVVISGPDELHLYDPITRADHLVPLSYAPQCLSISPDGLKAAVGHSGFVSVVNLQTRVVEKVIASHSEAGGVLLTGNGWIYVFSSGYLSVIDTAQQTVRPEYLYATPTVARLHASGNFAYLALMFSTFLRLDVRNGGTATSQPEYGVASCGNLWVSEDGQRLYSGCGGVYRSSETPNGDGLPNGTLQNSSFQSAAWIAHSSARRQIAAVASNSFDSLSSLYLYGDDGLPLLGRVRLQERMEGGVTFPVRGRWVFWNRAADRVFAITQIAEVAGSTGSSVNTQKPLSDHAVQVVSPEAVAACAVVVTPVALTIPAEGGSSSLMVDTGPGCVWTARSSSNFGLGSADSTVPGERYTGAGPGELRVHIGQNWTAGEITATITVGEAVVTARQLPRGPLTVSQKQFIVRAAESVITVFVEATGAGLPWSAIANDNWITLQNGPNYVGSATVHFRVAANTGAARVGTLTIAGETVRVEQADASQPVGMRFVPVAPCRVVDTRGETGQTGAFGTPVMEPGTQRDFPIPQGRCNIPSTATAYSLNATVVPRGPLSYLTLWPTGQWRPLVSTLNSFDGRIKANAAIVPAGVGGGISAFVTDRSDVILDINGYFIPPAGSSGPTSFPFYALTPCRVVDTRSAAGGNGGPSMTAGQTRNFVITGACNGGVPTSAIAYSLNVTVIPKSGPLSYVTMWPTGVTQPIVSTLNAPTGTVVANAAIVPSGVGGAISVYATDAADVVIDINGYFAASGPGTPLLFFPVAPCRVSDSRNATILSASSTTGYVVPTSSCNIPVTARAYSMNATVVPSGPLSFLTLWPAGQTQPVVSTLNSFDASVVANAVLVPAGTNGAISAFVTDLTHLILDINGFFAQ